VQEKAGKRAKRLALGVIGIYKFGDGQIRLTDFKQPVGMKMNPENRWVKKAEIIPWTEIEQHRHKQ